MADLPPPADGLLTAGQCGECESGRLAEGKRERASHVCRHLRERAWQNEADRHTGRNIF